MKFFCVVCYEQFSVDSIDDAKPWFKSCLVDGEQYGSWFCDRHAHGSDIILTAMAENPDGAVRHIGEGLAHVMTS